MTLSSRILIFLIRFYRKWISPFLGSHCRFYPSCSAYAEEAMQKKGAAKGFFSTTLRLLKCHPFHPGGFDPVD